MKHRIKGRKLHRKKDQRKALLKSLGSSLILKGSIITTEARAKDLRIFIEKKITKAKRKNLTAIRYLRKYFSEKVVQKLVKEIAPALENKKGGYTRIIKVNPRKTNGAKMVKIELIK